MSIVKIFGRLLKCVAVLAALAACSWTERGVYVAQTRPDIPRFYNLQQLVFTAPETLLVSESDGFFPNADVVWRGDPAGDRLQQIAALFGEAANRTKLFINSDIPIIADIELVRFHGITQRLRRGLGGSYAISFYLTVRDARNGAVIEQRRLIQTKLRAPGGAEARELEAAGRTERVQVIAFLVEVLRAELTSGPVATQPGQPSAIRNRFGGPTLRERLSGIWQSLPTPSNLWPF